MKGKKVQELRSSQKVRWDLLKNLWLNSEKYGTKGQKKEIWKSEENDWCDKRKKILRKIRKKENTHNWGTRKKRRIKKKERKET